MPRILNLLLLVVGVIVVGVGIAGLGRGSPVFVALLIVGISAVAIAFLSDRRRERRHEQKRSSEVGQRIAELTTRPWTGAQSLSLPQSVWGAVFLLLLVLVGGFLLQLHVASAIPPPGSLVGGVLLVAVGGAGLSRKLAGWGRPALELTTAGVGTPLNGRIAWRDISGVALSELATRGRRSYRLMLQVPRFAQVVRTVHWTDQLLAAIRLGPLARGTVVVPLASTRERPAVVYAVARALWKQSTGNDYEWNPLASNELNAALKRTGEYTARIRQPAAVHEAVADPRRALEDMERVRADMELIAHERKRQATRAKWITGVIVLVAAVRLAFGLFKAFGRA